MPADPSLTLAQWFSPGFPLGAFAYSHGLEAAIVAGEGATPDDLAGWIATLLRHGSGRNDAILLCAAYRASPHGLAALDDLCRALCAAAGRRVETDEQGAAFARTLRGIHGTALDDHCLPIAVGRAAALHALPLDAVLSFHLHAFAANLVSAATRRVPLGQVAGQRVLAGLHPVIAEVAAEATALGLDDLASTAFAADIAAMRHDTLPSRVFRS